MTLHLAQDEAADALLAADPLALLIGMQLDQQFPMERAFGSPYLLARRLGVERLDAGLLADADPVEMIGIFTGPPALHRYPGSMAARVQALARVILADFGGDAAAIWTGATSGADLKARLQSLPGFGDQKSRIFIALLGKQLGVQPDGWREAAGSYGDDGTHRSVADVTGPDSLAAVREFKRAARQAAKGT